MNDVLTRLKWKINLFRRRKYWSAHNCIFVHVPKAAGTSINKAIYNKTLGHYSASEIKSAFPDLFDRAFTFSFVRNPWDRALSAYRFAKIGKTESMGVHKPFQYKIPEFDNFERFIKEWLVHQDLYKTDFIFRPQHIFVCDSRGRLLVDFIGKTENIQFDLAHVSSKIGKNIMPKKVNSTSGGITDYRSAYKNCDMVDLVYSLYREDADKFDYRFE